MQSRDQKFVMRRVNTKIIHVHVHGSGPIVTTRENFAVDAGVREVQKTKVPQTERICTQSIAMCQ